MSGITDTSLLRPGGMVPSGLAPTQESDDDVFNNIMNKDDDGKVEIEPADAPTSLQKLFTDPEKMLKMWLLGETKPNPFASEQKDPMESFGKFIQSMLMQTQTDALTHLKDTMTRNNKYAASSLIDQIVEIESNSMTISPQQKTVQNFMVPEEADAFEVEIKNSSKGAVVYKNMAHNPGAGINQFEWDGKDNAGNIQPYGDYTLSVRLLKKTVDADGMTHFEKLEDAKDLDGKAIIDKPQNLSRADNEIQFSYELPDGLPDLEYASVWILNSKGEVVHKGEIEGSAGKKGIYNWNCLDFSGDRLLEDIYKVSINLRDSSRKVLKTDKQAIVKVSGKVHGLEINEKGEPNLVTSRIKAPLSAVTRIVNERGL